MCQQKSLSLEGSHHLPESQKRSAWKSRSDCRCRGCDSGSVDCILAVLIFNRSHYQHFKFLSRDQQYGWLLYRENIKMCRCRLTRNVANQNLGAKALLFQYCYPFFSPVSPLNRIIQQIDKKVG